MENHHVSWKNPLFLWPFSITFCICLPGDISGKQTPIFRSISWIFPIFSGDVQPFFDPFWPPLRCSDLLHTRLGVAASHWSVGPAPVGLDLGGHGWSETTSDCYGKKGHEIVKITGWWFGRNYPNRYMKVTSQWERWHPIYFGRFFIFHNIWDVILPID